jgi:hypothetical protein
MVYYSNFNSACTGILIALFYLDYVFVDEHNRHKRLKGKPVILA